jgi:hypothetical protein
LFPDGRHVAIGHSDGSLFCYDLNTGRVAWDASEKQSTSPLLEIAVSPRGRYVASSRSNGEIKIRDGARGHQLKAWQGATGNTYAPVAWSPDEVSLARAVYGQNEAEVWQIPSGHLEFQLQHTTQVLEGLDWSSDGSRIATAAPDGVRIWDARTGTQLQHLRRCRAEEEEVWRIRWSPDDRKLLFGYGRRDQDQVAVIWDATSGNVLTELKCKSGCAGVAWSPDGYWCATGSQAGEIRVWNPNTGEVRQRFQYPEEERIMRLEWASHGGFLVSGHDKGKVCFWDVREFAAGRSILQAGAEPGRRRALPRSWSLLPTSLSQHQRLGIHPPLALVRDVLELTGGRDVEGPLAELRNEPGLQQLAALQWPKEARIGLAALLLHELPLDGWQPPPGLLPHELRELLHEALASGEEITPYPAPRYVQGVREAVRGVNDRLLTMLSILGPDAVSADPGLPIRLLPRLAHLPPLKSSQRQRIGLRLREESFGRSSGVAPGVVRSGIETQGDLRNLLPSQLAFPREVLAYRHAQGQLLYRAREGSEPPRWRPTILLLDVSPPALGPVEAILRPAADVLARTLRERSVPVWLVTTGSRDGGELIRPLEHAADLIEIWTERTFRPACAARSLRLALSLRGQLREGDQEPMILVLSHPWFGADESPLPEVPELRGLFVQYPRHQVHPFLADHCQRWQSLAPHEVDQLESRLGELAG